MRSIEVLRLTPYPLYQHAIVPFEFPLQVGWLFPLFTFNNVPLRGRYTFALSSALFSNNYQLMNMIRGIQAPDYTSKECSGCEKKYFCSYCIIRGLVAAKEKGFENCAWYSQYIPNEFRRLLI